MKKTCYIRPNAEIIHISTLQMIAVSGIDFDDDHILGNGFLNDDLAPEGGSAL